MTEPTFAEHEARMDSYESGLVLGQLCWFSIPEMRVDHAVVVRQMQQSGLDQLTLPPVPRTADVFKRACTAAQKKRVYTADPGILHNYMVREVGKDSERIWRQLVLEVVDTNGRSLDYQRLVELTFDRASNTISVEWLQDPKTSVPAASEIITEIRHYYKEWNNALTSYALRELIRNLLERLHSTVVRPSGGVYFVHEEHCDMLFALEDMVNNLPGGCSFHTLPLLDDRKQRDMLRKAFEEESIGEIDRILGEMSEILKSDAKITSARYADYANQYNTLTAKVAEYSDLLDEAMVQTASRLEIMQATIISLMDTVKV